MRIRWTRQALSRLKEIESYISAQNPEAATRVLRRIHDIVGYLGEQPLAGRAGRVDGTRELILGDFPYIIAYRVKPNAIEVLAVLHASRRWPDKF